MGFQDQKFYDRHVFGDIKANVRPLIHQGRVICTDKEIP